MAKTNMAKAIAAVLLIVLVFLIPVFVESAYWLHLIIQMSLMTIMTTGLYLIFTTGQVSFAHAGFAGIGAYTSAMLALTWGIPYWIALPAAAIMPGLFALVIGWITLRIKGAYFFLATFAFGQIVVLIISNYLTDVFGGVSGLTRIPGPSPISLPGGFIIEFVGKIPFYYLALVLALVTVLVMYRIDGSRIGHILKAIQAGDSLSESVGINIMKYKIIIFVIASGFAGLAGSFMAHYFHAIAPDGFSFDLGMQVVVFMLVGGATSVAGPIVGVVALELLSHFLRTFGQAYEVIAYGVALVAVIMFLPGGLISLPQRIFGLMKRLVVARKGLADGQPADHP